MTLSEEEKKTIFAFEIFKTYKKGTVLLKKGELSRDSCFEIKGCIRCYYDVDGEEKTTAYFTESKPFSPQ
jgi:hypothetical protein